ncbi:hypothetical protein SDC9_94448 [bioreactor metagenome]|uniref:Uncharacterized protein n=1 Tax=bioreactor metagenome TaxID=1076179 RepID=A0A645ADJ3_9ZZZZ
MSTGEVTAFADVAALDHVHVFPLGKAFALPGPLPSIKQVSGILSRPLLGGRVPCIGKYGMVIRRSKIGIQ